MIMVLERHGRQQERSNAPGVARTTALRTTLASIFTWIGICSPSVLDEVNKRRRKT